MAKSFPNTGATVGLAADRSALTSPFAGMQFFETDTKALYLYNGSAWVSMLDTDTPPGLVHISTTTTTAAASVTIASPFSATYERYKIMLRYLNSSSDQEIRLQLTAASVPATAGAYSRSGFTNTSTTITPVGAAGATSFGIGRARDDFPATWEVDMIDPFAARRAMCFSKTFDISSGYVYQFGAQHVDTNSFDGIKIFPDAGTFTGTASIYGYRI